MRNFDRKLTSETVAKTNISDKNLKIKQILKSKIVRIKNKYIYIYK